jgi:hypothetical protein
MMMPMCGFSISAYEHVVELSIQTSWGEQVLNLAALFLAIWCFIYEKQMNSDQQLPCAL